MSKNKNYNSIVFLTTLSVYLGLVLSGGATPSVLAHSALTLDFDLKNEIVFEEDLDKKPEDGIGEDVEKVKNFKIAEALIDFVAELKKLESGGELTESEIWNFSHTVLLEEFGKTNRSTKISNVSSQSLEKAIETLFSTARVEYSESISDWLKNSENKNSRKSSVEVKSSPNEISLSFGFTKKSTEDARIAADSFNKIFIEKKVALKNLAQLPIYENTKAIAENNQIFIVTRLPRASIDSLIAQKDAR